jgi:hypothetical protein
MFFVDFEKEKQLASNSTIFSSYLVFYRSVAQKIADFVIKADGNLDLDKASQLLQQFSNSDFHLKEHVEHIKYILNLLVSDKSLQKKILAFDLPITSEFERFVRLSLELSVEPITKTLLRKACLSALISYLRQTVGSCFATAPCLYVLQNHPEYFFDDLYLMSKKNSLERLAAGTQISVPMALSVGEHFLETLIQEPFTKDSLFHELKAKHLWHEDLVVGKTIKECLGTTKGIDLYSRAYHPLLKIWEYTMASFCDAKGEFTESTLYLTLGLDSRIPDGLGEFFYNTYQKKLDEKHLLLVQAQNEAFLAHQRLVMAEAMAKNATNEASFHRSKSEIIAANYQLHSKELDIEDAKKEESKIKQLYETKIAIMKETIPKFFQESYDPDLVNMKSYSEDAPAGFRLFVKDGQLTSRFKPIKTEDDFISALKMFFETIERNMLTGNFDKSNQSLISNVITETIQFSSSKTFLEKTYLRAQKRHPKALPWAYVSGGTLETLLKTYFRKEILKMKSIRGDTLMELFIELIDYFKSLPETHLEPLRLHPHQGLLLETKTHACQLLPGNRFFRSFWESSGFTYTEVRDKLIEQGRLFFTTHQHKTITKEFFLKHRKSIQDQTIDQFLSSHENPKEAFFLITSFLFAEIKDDVREKTCGYCHIGDTNWTYNQLIIGYNPRKDGLSLFAQDPETLGLFELDHMEVFPMQWKLYEDLTRPEIMIPGIKI